MSVRSPRRFAFVLVLFAMMASLAGCAGDSPTEIEANQGDRCYWDGAQYVCV